MAYDESLADRVRTTLGERDWAEKRMFGGLAFLLGGHMAVAVSGQGGLMVRCDPATTDDHVAVGAARMVMRGKEMDGWLRVTEEALESGAQHDSDSHLQHWVDVGAAYAASLPPKS